MMEEELVKYVIQNSFAIAVTGFLLWERSTVTVKTTKVLTEMSATMAVICDKLK